VVNGTASTFWFLVVFQPEIKKKQTQPFPANHPTLCTDKILSFWSTLSWHALNAVKLACCSLPFLGRCASSFGNRLYTAM